MVSGLPSNQLISSGASVLDELLEGGLKSAEILQIYGPGGVGKTTLALQFAINTARQQLRVFYVYPEGKFPIIRLKQLAPEDFENIAPLITVVSPTSFNEQALLVSRLESLLTSDVQLLVFDTIVSLYRKEYRQESNNLVLNRRLNQQFGVIVNLARSRSLSVIIVNQVRGDIGVENGFQPVAHSISSYWSTYSLQITRAKSKGYREFNLIKDEEAAEEPETFTLELQSIGFR
jgi:RecA/RadA recombinase